MSDVAEQPPAAEATAPKKKGKLPIIMVLVLVLGGGGFFAMKLKGGAKKPEIKLSKEKAFEFKEFLVNLKDKGVYCRAEIALGVAEGTDAKAVEDHEVALRDAINMRLSSKSLEDVSSEQGLKELKHELATDMNRVLDEKKSEAVDPPKRDSKSAKGEKPAASAPEHPDWDSDTGPILKVYFSSFATQ